jgi:hypothetical protein
MSNSCVREIPGAECVFGIGSVGAVFIQNSKTVRLSGIFQRQAELRMANLWQISRLAAMTLPVK